jgi:hypothetical protein
LPGTPGNQSVAAAQLSLVPLVHVKTGTVSQEKNTMHETHRQAAEHHELAAQAHRAAAEHNEKGDFSAAIRHSERALEYADHAYTLAQEAHNKSGRIESI